jgi:hypothetical protein
VSIAFEAECDQHGLRGPDSSFDIGRINDVPSEDDVDVDACEPVGTADQR